MLEMICDESVGIRYLIIAIRCGTKQLSTFSPDAQTQHPHQSSSVLGAQMRLQSHKPINSSTQTDKHLTDYDGSTDRGEEEQEQEQQEGVEV